MTEKNDSDFPLRKPLYPYNIQENVWQLGLLFQQSFPDIII